MIAPSLRDSACRFGMVKRCCIGGIVGERDAKNAQNTRAAEQLDDPLHTSMWRGRHGVFDLSTPPILLSRYGESSCCRSGPSTHFTGLEITAPRDEASRAE